MWNFKPCLREVGTSVCVGQKKNQEISPDYLTQCNCLQKHNQKVVHKEVKS